MCVVVSMLANNIDIKPPHIGHLFPVFLATFFVINVYMCVIFKTSVPHGSSCIIIAI